MDKRYYLHDDTLWQRVFDDLGGQVSGVYHLFGETENGAPIAIDRMMGKEPTGLLYIGGSNETPNRVGKLRGGIMALYGVGTYKSKPHSAGWKMERIAGFTSKFPFEGLYLNVCLSDEIFDDGRPWFRKHESRLIETYREKWGETPPLNG